MRSMINRRTFVLCSIVGALGMRFPAHAQSGPKLPRIGYLAFNAEQTGRHVFTAFRQTMRDLGWTHGENIVIETRFADGDVDRLPALIALAAMNTPTPDCGSMNSEHW